MGLFTAILNTVGLAADAAAAYIIIWKVLFRKPIVEWAQSVSEAYSMRNTPSLMQNLDGYVNGADPAQPKFEELRRERLRARWSMGLVVFGLLCNCIATWIGYVASAGLAR